jgi:protein SCO1
VASTTVAGLRAKLYPMKKYRPFITLFLVLILPLIIYGALKLMTKPHYRPIEILSQKIPNPDGSPDSVYKVIGDFAFVTQTGDTLRRDSLKGKIWVASLFSTNCADDCSKMGEWYKKLQEDYAERDEVRLVSFSSDPAHDSIPALRAYADKMGATNYKWYFLSGNPQQMEQFIKVELQLRATGPQVLERKAIGDHRFKLLDWRGWFRGGVYEGNVEDDVIRMAQSIKQLQAEYEDSVLTPKAGK